MSFIFPKTNESSHSPSALLLLHIVSVVTPCNATLLYLIFSLLIYIFFLSTSFSIIYLSCVFSSLLSFLSYIHITHISTAAQESYLILYINNRCNILKNQFSYFHLLYRVLTHLVFIKNNIIAFDYRKRKSTIP